MMIAIDGYEANVSRRVGSGRYAYEIIRNIYFAVKKLKISHERDRLEFRIYLPHPPVSDLPEETDWWRYRVVGPSRLWTIIGLPIFLFIDRPKADVIFSPTHYIPRFISTPRVMSVMDLSYLEYPEMFKPKDLHQLVHWTEYSVKHAVKIFTISEFSKRAILKKYGINGQKVQVIYPGLTQMSGSSDKIMRKTGDKYSLSDNYVLAVGTLQPRKNFELLIAAFARILPDFSDIYPGLQLVIVGKKGWLYDAILAAPEKHGIAKSVKFLDFVPDEDLPGLYSQALCFALPSLYEGFGLPVLEAMAHNCQTVVSRSSSLPEIGGDAAIYVDPQKLESVAAGLKIALQEYNHPAAKKRLQLGREQVKRFSWEAAARLTIKSLEEAGQKKS